MEKNFRNFIQQIISLLFVFIIIFSSITTFLIIKNIAHPIFYKFEQQKIENIASTILLELENKIKTAESLSISEAGIYKALEKKNHIFKKVIPGLLNLSGYENIIAGGGVWPEPYTFNKNRFYRGFFWGRNEKGILIYYKNYNNPSGKGYFHEEWYVPAKYLIDSKTYWSRLYTDPYSKQPMVTCTAPIKEKNKFLGVATVDLKLEGLEKLFSFYANKLQGYIFVLDRENHILYFPDKTIIFKEKRKSQNFTKLQDLAKKYKEFELIEKKINKIDNELIFIAKKKSKFFSQIVDNISNQSYQITKNEAILIATSIINPLKSNYSSKLENFIIKNDLILKEPAICSLFYMPKTYWKIGIVIPQKLLSAMVSNISWDIIVWLIFSQIIILLLGFFLIKHYLLSPLKKITLQLAQSKDKNNPLIEYKKNDELGKLVYFFNKRTEELKERENYIRALFEQSPVSIQIFDKDGTAIDANKAWEKLWGLKKEDFNGRYNIFRDKIFKNSKEFEYIKEVFKGKPLIIKNFEYKLKTVTKRGRDRILNVIMFPILDRNSNVERVVIMQEDITDKVKIEESLKKVGQLEALGELSAGIAHDFNNILTGISLNLEMLEIILSDDQKALNYINKIKKSIESAKGLINKIKMLSSQEKYKFSIFNFENILKESIDIIKTAIPSNIELNHIIEGNNFWIECDKNSIIQLLINLIINARDAIILAKREKGIIEIILKKENNFMVLSISDNGMGIPEEIKDKIFEPFFTTKQKDGQRGTGLGLSIVYNTVKMHNGEIEVKSKEGEGTTFLIKFPLISDKEIKKEEEKDIEIELTKNLYNKTVLLVEDEENIREVEGEMLKYLNFNIISATNGKEALEIIKSGKKIDIILIDWYMPVMNGEEAILKIKEINDNIPIFVVSGAISKKIEEFKRKNIILDIINKPFNKKEVIEKLNKYFA